MAMQNTGISTLTDGFNKCIVRVRVVRSWKAINVKTAEVYSKDMLLLDEQGICIHAQIPERLIDRLEKSFIDSGIVTIQYFKVCPAQASYRPVSNNKKIQFLRNSIVRLLPDVQTAPGIPLYYFDFAKEDVISSRKGNHYVLTDVIGKVQHVGPTRQVVANGAQTIVRDVSIKLNGDSIINLTLWGQFNDSFNVSEFGSFPQPIIIAVASVSVTTYQGKTTLNTNSSSHVYINPDIPEATTLRARFQSEAPVDFNMLPSVEIRDDATRDLPQRTSIAEILALEWSPDFQDEHYAVRATIKSINAEFGWCYNACASCSTKVSYKDGKMFCKKCNEPIANTTYRYKVHVVVVDETAEGELTMFDSQIFQLIKTRAAQLFSHQLGQPEQIPQQIQNLCNKTFTFEIKVSNRNLQEGWNSYLVSRIFDDRSCDTESIGTSTTMLQTPLKKEKKRRYLKMIDEDDVDDVDDDLSQKKSVLRSTHMQAPVDSNENIQGTGCKDVSETNAADTNGNGDMLKTDRGVKLKECQR